MALFSGLLLFLFDLLFLHCSFLASLIVVEWNLPPCLAMKFKVFPPPLPACTGDSVDIEQINAVATNAMKERPLFMSGRPLQRIVCAWRPVLASRLLLTSQKGSDLSQANFADASCLQRHLSLGTAEGKPRREANHQPFGLRHSQMLGGSLWTPKRT